VLTKERKWGGSGIVGSEKDQKSLVPRQDLQAIIQDLNEWLSRPVQEETVFPVHEVRMELNLLSLSK
jgi:hypothetical protein